MAIISSARVITITYNITRHKKDFKKNTVTSNISKKKKHLKNIEKPMHGASPEISSSVSRSGMRS